MTLVPSQPAQVSAGAGAANEAVPPASEPLLRVVRGVPTPEELAALTAVMVALSSEQDEPGAAAPQRTWARRNHLRLAPQPGPGSWRRSSL